MTACKAARAAIRTYSADNWGQDTVTDSAGTGDALDFGGVSVALTIDLLGGRIESGANAVTFSGIEAVHGGQADDIFYIDGTQAYDLYGNDGDDQFIFLNEGRLLGLIDGGAGQRPAGLQRRYNHQRGAVVLQPDGCRRGWLRWHRRAQHPGRFSWAST